MDRQNRKFRLGAILGISVFALLVVGSMLDSLLLAPARAGQLPDWMEPGVRLNLAKLDKRLFLSIADQGEVTDIQIGELRSPRVKIKEIGVAGSYGAQFFDLDGRLDASIPFAVPRPGDFQVGAKILPATAGHGLLFFRQSGVAATYDSLVDEHGVELWRTPYHPFSSTYGNVGPGGNPEFFFAKPDAGLEARNLNGELLWSLPPKYREDVMLVDSFGAKPRLIVDVAGQLNAFTTEGKLLFTAETPEHYGFADASVTWPGVCNSCLLTVLPTKMILSKPGHDELAPAMQLPIQHSVLHAHAVSLRLIAGQPPYLAVAGLLAFQGNLPVGLEAVHARLFIFDHNQKLVYDEILPERVSSLARLSVADGKRDMLLVGGENRVWAYTEQ